MLKRLLFLIFFLKTLQKSDVYFTKKISSTQMVNMLKKLNINLTGKIGLKIHSGEPGGLYFLKPDFLQEIYDYTKGDFLECNTAYSSVRSNTESHRKLLEENGWTKNNRRIVIMDENPSDDFELKVKNSEMIGENFVGGHLKDYDSCVVLSHFKGHQMGGFGGALKQLSIGFASQKGKTWIHTAGKYTDWKYAMSRAANQENFTSAMADAASTIVDYFRNKGQIAFITVMANISLSCDCAGRSAPAPKIKDIGILASTDPVAIDRAALDLVKQSLSDKEGVDQLYSQINRLKGENTIDIAAKIGVGSLEYNLINIDDDEPDSESNEDEDEEEMTITKNNNSKHFIFNKMELLFLLLIFIIC